MWGGGPGRPSRGRVLVGRARGLRQLDLLVVILDEFFEQISHKGQHACRPNSMVGLSIPDDPKSKTSKRPLTLGYLVDRYRLKAVAAKADDWVFVRTDGSGLPLWDSGVRKALKLAAAADGCDFEGLGPHSFRRANITMRQAVGASSIEASKIAGHSTVRMTEEYTKVQLTRQDETTRLIQERLASVGEKQPAVVQ
jgi:integrase